MSKLFAGARANATRVSFTYDGYNLNHDVMEHEKLRSIIGGYEILICEYDTISKDFLEAATNLKIIICCRGGVKSVVDLEEAEKRGIIVCNNSGRNASAVADLVLGYMIDMTRHITASNNSIHNRIITQDTSTKPKEYQDTMWGLNNDSPFIRFRGRSLNHMAPGIFGFGCVGRLVAQRTHAFGMRIITCHPFTPKKELPEYVEDVNWDEFLVQSDVISAHCLLTDKSRNMFNKGLFAKMKDGAYFINTARGGIVVEDDMLAALKIGKLAGGSGTRFTGMVPKQYCLLAGKEVISYSIEAFRKAAAVDEGIVIVDAKEYAEGRIAKTYGVTTMLGGSTRNESFGNALAYIRKNFPACTKIIENNAACPLVQPQQIDAMVAVLDEYDYVQFSFKITDALGSYSCRIADREDYFLIQAPDAYRFPLLDSCFDAAHPNGHPAVQLPTEARGYFYFVEGQPFKITYPDDLEIAEILLQRTRR